MSTSWALISDLSVTDQDNSQDMKKKRYKLLCLESSCTHVTGLPSQKPQKSSSSSSRSQAVSPPRKSKKRRRNCEVSAVAPDPLKWCQMSNLSIEGPHDMDEDGDLKNATKQPTKLGL